MAQISYSSNLSAVSSFDSGTIRLTSLDKKTPLNLRANEGFAPSGLSLSRASAISAQQSEKFVRDNKDLLYVIDNSEEAKDLLEKKDVSTRWDLIGVIAETANSLLSGEAATKLSTSYLSMKPVLASMIVLNTGNIRDHLEKTPSLGSLLSDEGAVEPEKDVFERVAKKASALFAEDNALHDDTFWKEHPNAMVYILRSANDVAQFNHPYSGKTDAQLFKYRAEREDYQYMFDNITSKYANEVSDNGTYSEAFFNTYKTVGQFVAAGEFLTDIPKPGRFFKDHPEYYLRNKGTADQFRFGEITGGVMAAQAQEMFGVGSPVTSEFLKSNVGFARFMIRDAQFRADITGTDSREQLAVLFGASQGMPSISAETISRLNKRYHSSYEDLSPVYSTIA